MNEIDAILVKNACFSADSVAIGFRGTEAEKTRAVIHRALEALLANNYITIVPPEERPFVYIPEPPYTEAVFKGRLTND